MILEGLDRRLLMQRGPSLRQKTIVDHHHMGLKGSQVSSPAIPTRRPSPVPQVRRTLLHRTDWSVARCPAGWDSGGWRVTGGYEIESGRAAASQRSRFQHRTLYGPSR